MNMGKRRYAVMGGYRATGRTFRALLRAIAHLSEGSNVFYEAGSQQMADWYMHKALAILHAYLPEDFIIVRKPQREIQLKESAGRIRFIHRGNAEHATKGFERLIHIQDD